MEVTWHGRLVDYGLLAVRNGYARLQAFAEALPGAYRTAQIEAMAESRGAWRECTLPVQLYTPALQGRAHVPPEVLYAVALNESSYGGAPWPWTLNVAGVPRYFPDRLSAWRVADALARGRARDFDIGLMQINWGFHRARLRDVWRALDPEINVRTAADMIAELSATKGGLLPAIGYYHSATPALRTAYEDRFRRHLDLASRRMFSTPHAESAAGTRMARAGDRVVRAIPESGPFRLPLPNNDESGFFSGSNR